MSRANDKFHGVLAVNKPTGMTSHDVVQKVRRLIRQRSIGHAGTLDPAADGLLLLCVGRATKVARYLTDSHKTYLAEITLGRESTTYDREGVDLSIPAKAIPETSDESLKTILREFTGRITQQVPAYSAVHVDGQRLYEKARRGEEVVLPEREVEIFSMNLVSSEPDKFTLNISCSKGTYIRSLAHDLGRRLGCGAYLSALTRTSSGNMQLAEAYELATLEAKASENKLADCLLSIEHLLDFSTVTLRDEFCGRVLHGVRPASKDILLVDGTFGCGDHVLVKNPKGTVLAIGTAVVPSDGLSGKAAKKVLSYERVLA